MTETVLTSLCPLPDPNRCFRLRAGPGAGKTTWLTTCIKQLAMQRDRLGSFGRIGCISYTETAAAELTHRLGPSAEYVDVSTIHSFLYRNLVGPYAHLLTDQTGSPLVATEELDGHSDHYPSVHRFLQHAEDAERAQLQRKAHAKGGEENIRRCLDRLRWVLKGKTWTLTASIERPRVSLPSASLERYKRYFWGRGELHHDDVLYFSHRLLHEQPFLVQCLVAKFPFLVVDEFQDTAPAQTEVIELLAKNGTVVGVVGDPAQSIFGFLGARPGDFDTIRLRKRQDLVLNGNHRSAPPIVEVLNWLRTDGLKQASSRESANSSIELMVGEKEAVWNFARTELQRYRSSVALFRSNREVASYRLGEGKSTREFAKEYLAADSNSHRCRFVLALAESIAQVRSSEFSGASETLQRAVRALARSKSIPLSRQKARLVATSLLDGFVRMSANLELLALTQVIIEARLLINQHDVALETALSKYNAKTDYSVETGFFEGLVVTSTRADERSPVRTIHKAKGAEFDAVFVWLEGDLLRAFLDPESADTEDRRVVYVALSRARSRLIIGTPGPISCVQESTLRSLGVTFTDAEHRDQSATSG